MSPSAYTYDPDWVSSYFDEFGEKEWERLVQTPADEVSLHIHTEILKEHLRPGMKVLEVGAAAGRFTQVLAGLGCRITVVDLSTGQLDLNRKKAEEFEFESAIDERLQMDMCEMTCLDAENFDAVVCYGGPLSYVFEQADRAIEECNRVLKRSGLFFCSVMSLWGATHLFLAGVLDLSPEVIGPILQSGDVSPVTEPGNTHRCHLYRSPDLRDLLERGGLSILEISSANFLSVSPEADLAEVRNDPDKWDQLLRLEREACRQPGCLDTGTHMIAVCRKVRNGNRFSGTS